MGDFDLTVGVLLIGIFINTYLYGLVTYQFIVYYTTKFNDPLWIRTIVSLLCILDTVHSAVAVYGAYETCVINFANPAFLGIVSWTIPFTACATAIASFLSQLFLSHRVWILTKNKFLTGGVLLLSICGFFFGMWSGIASSLIGVVTKFGTLTVYVTLWLGFQTAADVLLTTILIFTLKKARTGFHKTDTLINRLIRGAVQTGLFASIFALCDLFFFMLRNDTNFYAMFAYPIGRIYTNTLLDTLNARTSLKNKFSSTMDVDTEGNTAAFRMQSHAATGNDGSHTVHSFHVKRDIVIDTASVEANDVKYKDDSRAL